MAKPSLAAESRDVTDVFILSAGGTELTECDVPAP